MSLKKVTEKKDDFSIEKIATAIHAEDLVSSLKNKYKDPLILFRRSLPKDKRRHTKEIKNHDPYQLNRMLFNKLLKLKLEDNKVNINNSNNILPIISPINQNIKNNLKNEESEPLLVTSGMFKLNGLYMESYKKLKLGNVMNFKNNDDSIYQELYSKIDNMKKFNDKYNLNLNLNYLGKELKNKNIKTKSVFKSSLLNYLYNIYILGSKTKSNVNSNKTINYTGNNDNNNNKADIKNKFFKIKESSSKIHYVDEEKNIKVHKREEKNEEQKTFLTKLNIKNKNSNNIIIKPKKSLFSTLFEKNKNIINHNKKVFVDCLYSSANSNLSENKIILDSVRKNGMSISLDRDPNYKKIKRFETNIDNIVKTNKNKTIANQK
jgi:hypothetical protein